MESIRIKEMCMKKWLWEEMRYPSFPYRAESLIEIIDDTAKKIGSLTTLLSVLDKGKEKRIAIDTLIEEILSTSAIEGEMLSVESVRSSVRKRLDENFTLGEDSSTHHTDALTALLIDSTCNHADLTLERLHQWHTALFAGGYASLFGNEIKTGVFRDYDDMQVVSGAHTKERVHYQALPADRIDKEIAMLLAYINESQENVYIKSAIAHLWFVTIHPYDDGNGRIARVISDYILSKALHLEYKYFSISSAIQRDKKGYYERLEQSQNLLYNREYDFTAWIAWHIKVFNDAIGFGLKKVDIVVQRAKFWNSVDQEKLNRRQIKVLNKLLEYGKGGFEGGLSTKKYMSMTKVSKPTAFRDIQALVSLGYLRQVAGSAGRSVKYEIVYGDSIV